MPTIVVDWAPKVPPLSGLEAVIELLLADIAEEARGQIIRLAGERLLSTFEDYVSNLTPVEFVPGAAEITLVGWLPNAVENGLAAFDMKPGLLAGRNAKTDKHGNRYNTVPFRHGTPGARGTSFQPMGRAYGPARESSRSGGTLSLQEARKLGQYVYREAKRLAGTVTTIHLRNRKLVEQSRWGGRLRPGTAPLLKAHHKTDIYAGMVRHEKLYERDTQAHYMTFRRVSEKSEKISWIHPGIEARRIFPDTAEYVGKFAGKIIGEAVAGLGAAE